MPITSSSQRCVWRAAGAGAAPQRKSLRARCAAHKGGERPLAPSSSSEAGVATSTRRLALSLLGVAGLGAALPATALGPENVDLEILDYQTVGARCAQGSLRSVQGHREQQVERQLQRRGLESALRGSR